MIDDPVLVNDWHVVARSSDVPESQVTGARLLGEDPVVWRRDGEVMVWKDLCVHRGIRLSLGQATGLGPECAYHGWTYDQSGRLRPHTLPARPVGRLRPHTLPARPEAACVHVPSRPDQKPPASTYPPGPTRSRLRPRTLPARPEAACVHVPSRPDQKPPASTYPPGPTRSRLRPRTLPARPEAACVHVPSRPDQSGACVHIPSRPDQSGACVHVPSRPDQRPPARACATVYSATSPG